jgi:hypothetical protein
MKAKITIAVFMLITGIAVGYFLSEREPEVKYIKGETVYDSIPYEKLVPYKVEVPTYYSLPLKRDTVTFRDTSYVEVVPDTAYIIADYIKRNTYKNTLFSSDTLGTLNVYTSIQYNKLQSLSYDFTPMFREVRTEKQFTPYVLASFNTFNQAGLGIGVVYKRNFFWGQRIFGRQDNGFQIGFGVRL